MRVGLIVDHPKRDLPGAIMIAHALARRGVETAMVPLYEQAVDVPLLGLDALVVNFARATNLDLVEGYADAGLPVAVLDTEGGVLAENGANAPATLAAYIRDSGYARLLAGYLFWGANLHEAFTRLSGIPPERLFVTGCPRFDFASRRWESLLDGGIRSGYVLVNANFPLVNPRFVQSPEQEKASLVRAGWAPEYVQSMLSDQRQILKSYVDTVLQLCLALPDTQFLLRPHPFENELYYVNALAGVPNISVDGAGSVLGVIRNASAVLHLNCGTSIESIMLRRLPISMEFLNTPHMASHSTLPSRVSLHADSYEQLLAVLQALPRATSSFDFEGRYREQIEPWFHYNDGRAADRAADALLGIATSKPRRTIGLVSGMFGMAMRASRRQPRPLQRVQACIANAIGTRAWSWLRGRLEPRRREKQLAIDAIRTGLDSVAAHEGIPSPSAWFARHPLTGFLLSSIVVRPR